jgi:hypothetical protein
MTVHRSKQRHIFFHCDECGEQALPDVYIAFSDFEEALEDIEDAGWVVELRYDDSREDHEQKYWYHRCWRCEHNIWP